MASSTTSATATPPERGCPRCAPHLFPSTRLNGLHYSWRLGVPVGIHSKWGVTLDGMRETLCTDAYVGTHGWIVRVAHWPTSDPAHILPIKCSCGAGLVLHNRVYGNVEIVPA